MQSIGIYSLLVMAVLMVVGGIIGFKKAGSKPSLIAGCLSGVCLALAFAFSLTKDAKEGMLAGLVLTIVLCGMFAVRFVKTKKFMPAGLLLSFTIAEMVLLTLTLFVFG